MRRKWLALGVDGPRVLAERSGGQRRSLAARQHSVPKFPRNCSGDKSRHRIEP